MRQKSDRQRKFLPWAEWNCAQRNPLSHQALKDVYHILKNGGQCGLQAASAVDLTHNHGEDILSEPCWPIGEIEYLLTT